MSAFVPGFASDLFISYAHEDDKGWVQAFQDELGDEISRRLGLPLQVWQDSHQIRAGANWQTAIQDGIDHAAAFVAIVSPRYQNSQWCARERKEFSRQVEADKLAASGRFFKAVKTPWPNNGHRLFLEVIQDVDFFKADHDGTQEFTPGSKDFKRAVRRLADGIEPLLRRMRRGNQRVHIAWPVDECLPAWQQLNDELRGKGFDVQPAGPRDASYADQLLLDDLDRAVLSVHLLGAAYDEFTERMALLAAGLQQQLMFWTTSAAESTTDPKQRALLDAIRRGVRPDDPTREWPSGWSLLFGSPVRSFIEAVVTKLRPQPAAAVVAADAGGASTIYIVHDATTPQDAEVAQALGAEIARREHMEVFVSKADLGTPTELKLRHESLLKSCDGVLLYRNCAPEGWWNQLAPEVILAEKRFERTPMKSRAFLVPKAPAWQVEPDVKVIPYLAPFQLSTLEPFLSPLRH